VQSLTFLKRRGQMADPFILSHTGKALLIDGGRWKAEVAAFGASPVTVTLKSERLCELLTLVRLLPDALLVSVVEPYLRVEEWSLKAESVVAA
jgi:hypothetical protein